MSDIYLSLTETPAVVSVTNPLVAAASFSVTLGTSVTVSNFPAVTTVAGTVTANGGDFAGEQAGSAPQKAVHIGYFDENNLEFRGVSNVNGPLPISGTVTARGNLIGNIQEETGSLLLAIDDLGVQNPVLANGNGHLLVSVQSGTVTASLSSANLNSVTVGVRGSVTVANFPATQVVSVSNFPASSSVTIANFPAVTTVAGTVALDSASLAALESVTVTIGAAVSISNFPTTQVVSVSNFPASSSVTIGGFSTSSLPPSTVTVGNTVTINGTVTANVASSSNIGIGFRDISGNLINVDNLGSNLPVNIFTSAGDSAVGFEGGDGVAGAVGIGHNSNGQFNVVGENSPLPISGTVTANVTNSVTVGSFPKITWTDYSGSVVTADLAVTAISTITRSYLLAQVTTGQIFLNIGATATSMNSVYFSAGQGFAWETGVPQGIVSIISPVTGSNYVLKDG